MTREWQTIGSFDPGSVSNGAFLAYPWADSLTALSVVLPGTPNKAQLWESSDGGASWSKTGEAVVGASLGNLEEITFRNGKFHVYGFGGGTVGLYQAADPIGSWTQSGGVIHPTTGQEMRRPYAVTSAGKYYAQQSDATLLSIYRDSVASVVTMPATIGAASATTYFYSPISGADCLFAYDDASTSEWKLWRIVGLAATDVTPVAGIDAAPICSSKDGSMWLAAVSVAGVWSIYRSTDGGSTWAAVHTFGAGFEIEGVGRYGCAIPDMTTLGTWWARVTNAGTGEIWTSTNDGVTWAQDATVTNAYDSSTYGLFSIGGKCI